MTPEHAQKIAPLLTEKQRSDALDLADAIAAFDQRVPCRIRTAAYSGLILRVAVVAGYRGEALGQFTQLVTAALRGIVIHTL